MTSDAAMGRRSLARGRAESERGRGFCAVGLAVAKIAAPLAARRGGGMLGRLKTEWPAIAGEEWAGAAWPTALGRDGALKLRAAPGKALELQHRAPLLIERVNLYFGRAVATRLVLVQGLPPSYATASGRTTHLPAGGGDRAAPPVTDNDRDERLCGIAAPELRDALAQLGRAVRSGGR